MTDDFSDAPLTVDGSTVKPGWDWSNWYRDEVAENLRASGKSHVSDHDAEQRYIDWYADQHGLPRDEAQRRVKAMLP